MKFYHTSPPSLLLPGEQKRESSHMVRVCLLTNTKREEEKCTFALVHFRVELPTRGVHRMFLLNLHLLGKDNELFVE